MKKILIYSIVVLFLYSCASSNKQKVYKTSEELEALISNLSFEIESQWAQPQVTSAMAQLNNAGLLPVGSSAGNIDIMGITNYLRFENDSVKGVLPFFGERQFGGAYNNRNGGIEFDGKLEDYEVKKGRKSGYEINFNIKDKNSNSEFYQVNVLLYPNLTSSINVNSNQRFNIRFRGNAKPIENKKDLQ